MVRLWDESAGVRIYHDEVADRFSLSGSGGLTNEQTIGGWWHRGAIAWVDGVYYIPRDESVRVTRV